MSTVTDVIITFALDPDEAHVAELNRFFARDFEANTPNEDKDGMRRPQASLLPVDDLWTSHTDAMAKKDGGPFERRVMQVVVMIGAYNYLDLPRFVAHIESIPWVARDEIQLFVNEENYENGFQKIDLNVLRNW